MKACIACSKSDFKLYTIIYFVPKEVIAQKRTETMGYICSSCFEELRNTKTESQSIITGIGYSADTE